MRFIETTEDAYVLLYNGYKLRNVTGGTVELKGCKQIITQSNPNIKRKRPYSFNHPEYWAPLDNGFTKYIEITSWMRFKAKIKTIMCRIVTLGGLL